MIRGAVLNLQGCKYMTLCKENADNNVIAQFTSIIIFIDIL